MSSLPPLDLDLEKEFPILQKRIFMNHAGVSPLPARTMRALQVWAEDACVHGPYHWPRWDADRERTRELFAQLIGATTDEVCFVKSTTHGLLIVANSLKWKPGDNIVTVENEFPANVYPWRHLASRGVELRVAPQRAGRFEPESLRELMDERTRLLTVSHVSFYSGFRCDLRRIGEICRERGVLFCVDAIQGLGAVPLDVREANIDFLSADGHKWLLSVEGFGGFYCRAEARKQLDDSMTGWAGRVRRSDYLDYEKPLEDSSLRFEEGAVNMCSAQAFKASLTLLREVGIPIIHERILALTDLLIAGLKMRGANVLCPESRDERSGIVVFESRSADSDTLVRRLAGKGIFLASRGGRVRVSPHFYNSPEQIETLLTELGRRS